MPTPNPPPSLPPSLPLPPVPGPSPISERDTLLFLSAGRSSLRSDLQSRPTSIASSVSSLGRPSLANRDSEDQDEDDAIERVLHLHQHRAVIPRQRVISPPTSPGALPFLPSSRRPSSPDISTILSSTPRPRRGTSKSRSNSLSRDHNKQKPTALAHSWSHRPGRARHRHRDLHRSRSRSRSRTRVRPQLSHTDDVDPLDPEMEARLERQLEGIGSGTGEESDSSLDLKTPLPNLMLRHGHLSPNSKLFPQKLIEPNPYENGTRPISTVSTSPSILKLKDERDTPKRRRRHRDGRLLRGGIGLTTGLGWSDSEDEDAPSALTRRLSTLDLSRRPSESFSVRSLPPGDRLTKSLSARPSGISESDEFGARATVTPRGTRASREAGSVPPTSWATKKPPAAANGNRTSTSSVGSARSSITKNLPGAVSRASSSTASSVSLVTPSGVEMDAGVVEGNGGTLSPKPDKLLPPLPGPVATTTVTLNGRGRACSSASTAVDLPSLSSPTSPSFNKPLSSSTSTPRPLHLLQSTPAKTLRLPSILRSSSASASTPSSVSTPTPGVKQGPGSGYGRHVNDQQRLRAASGPRYSDSVLLSPLPADTTASPASPAKTNPKPRTGTGMTYRTTTSQVSRLRMPGASGGGGGGASTAPSTPTTATASTAFASNSALPRASKVTLVA